MSIRSLTQAIAGALVGAQTGHAYLIGDENLTFAAFFQLFFDLAGNPVQVGTVDANNALLPDAFIVQDRGNHMAYDPDPVETAMLGYARGDIRRAVAEVVHHADTL